MKKNSHVTVTQITILAAEKKKKKKKKNYYRTRRDTVNRSAFHSYLPDARTPKKKSNAEKKILLDILLDILFKFDIPTHLQTLLCRGENVGEAEIGEAVRAVGEVAAHDIETLSRKKCLRKRKTISNGICKNNELEVNMRRTIEKEGKRCDSSGHSSSGRSSSGHSSIGHSSSGCNNGKRRNPARRLNLPHENDEKKRKELSDNPKISRKEKSCDNVERRLTRVGKRNINAPREISIEEVNNDEENSFSYEEDGVARKARGNCKPMGSYKSGKKCIGNFDAGNGTSPGKRLTHVGWINGHYLRRTKRHRACRRSFPCYMDMFEKECDNIRKAQIIKMLLRMKNENVFSYLRQCSWKVLDEVVSKNVIKLFNVSRKETVKLLLIEKKKEKGYFKYFFNPNDIIQKLKKKPFFLYRYLKKVRDVKCISTYFNLLLFLTFIFEPASVMNLLQKYYAYVSFKMTLFLISFFNHLFITTTTHKCTLCNGDIWNCPTCLRCGGNTQAWGKQKGEIHGCNYTERSINTRYGGKCTSYFKNDAVMLLYTYFLMEYVQKDKLMELFNHVKEKKLGYKKKKIHFFLHIKAFIYVKFGYIRKAVRIYKTLNNYIELYCILKKYNIEIDDDMKKRVRDILICPNVDHSKESLENVDVYTYYYNTPPFRKNIAFNGIDHPLVENGKIYNPYQGEEMFEDMHELTRKYRILCASKKKFMLKGRQKMYQCGENMHIFRQNGLLAGKKLTNYKSPHRRVIFRKADEKGESRMRDLIQTKKLFIRVAQTEENKERGKERDSRCNRKNCEDIHSYFHRSIQSSALDNEIMYSLYGDMDRSKYRNGMNKRRSIWSRSADCENRQYDSRCRRNHYPGYSKSALAQCTHGRRRRHYWREGILRDFIIKNANEEMSYVSLVSILEELFYQNELCENYYKILTSDKISIFNLYNFIKKRGYVIYNGKMKKEIKNNHLTLLDIKDYYFLSDTKDENMVLMSHHMNYIAPVEMCEKKLFHVEKPVPPQYYLYDQIHKNAYISSFSSFCTVCLNNIYHHSYAFSNKKKEKNNIIFFFCNHLYHLRCMKSDDRSLFCEVCL
ncbi:conserved Plasmodium protein, unknown function [Plasmodium ovale wallikeri]|uniref:RING-type domain-containing protein n=1 Tax=Plasmodium ovale wallikeri TaxID=864142 RepID=A0A1A9AJP2_PLAOA|nr:conserved Plasmodium protein, unknown function [Plasmodium ovale wallikeri]